MRRVLRWIALGLVAVLVLAGVVFGPGLVRMAQVGAGYVAKCMCSCVYVAERDFDSCRPDIPENMDRIEAALLESEEGVRASVLGIIERKALHRPGTGCTLY
jgi:hypothetical protein